MLTQTYNQKVIHRLIESGESNKREVLAMYDIPVGDYKSEILRQYEVELRGFKKQKIKTTAQSFGRFTTERLEKLKQEYDRIEQEQEVKSYTSQFQKSIKERINFFQEFLERTPELSKEVGEILKTLYDIKRSH